MRERVTFVQPRGEGVDPQSLDVQEAGLLGPLIDTVREDRFTLTLDELRPELASLFGGFEEFHVRWASPIAHEALEPFVSRISPGLHLSYTLAKADAEHKPAAICAELTRFEKFDCAVAEAFTSSSKAGKPVYYFYQELESLHEFRIQAILEICPELDPICQARIRGLHTSSSLDISWDVASGKLKIAALWPLREQGINVPQSKLRRTEVGVLAQDVPPNMQSHEVGLSGLLTVLGESKEPSPTLFSFPTRHRAAAGTFSTKFLTPTGLHPNLQLTLNSVNRPEGDETCKLFTHLTLPKVVFADRYQLGDDLFLASKNLTSLRHTTLPVDLEAPVWTTEVWGSSILLELSPGEDSWTAEVPLHLRYLQPSPSGESEVEVAYPVVFWACESSADARLSDNPFDRTHLSYDGLFEDNTVFWHVTPRPEDNRLMNEIKVPVLKLDAASYISIGTGIAVAVGFSWVLWVLFRVFMQSSGSTPAKATSKGTKKKQ